MNNELSNSSQQTNLSQTSSQQTITNGSAQHTSCVSEGQGLNQHFVMKTVNNSETTAQPSSENGFGQRLVVKNSSVTSEINANSTQTSSESGFGQRLVVRNSDAPNETNANNTHTQSAELVNKPATFTPASNHQISQSSLNQHELSQQANTITDNSNNTSSHHLITNVPQTNQGLSTTQQAQLPQTGNQAANTAIVGGGLALLLTTLAYVIKSKIFA